MGVFASALMALAGLVSQPSLDEAASQSITAASVQEPQHRSMVYLRRAVERNALSASEISAQLDLWKARVSTMSRGEFRAQQVQEEINTFEAIRQWVEVSDVAFEALMEDVLIERGVPAVEESREPFADFGYARSGPYVHWVAALRGDSLGMHGQMLLAASRINADDDWYGTVDLEYWAAEQAGASDEALAAFRSLLRRQIYLDFDDIDYQWVMRSTSSEFMSNPAISLAFDYIDEARSLRAER